MDRQRRRSFRVVGVAAVALLSTCGAMLAGCSSQATGGGTAGGSAGASVKGAHIRVLAEPISWTDNIKKLLPQFEKESGITVTVDTVPYTDEPAKIALNFSQKSSTYDVVFTDNVYGVGYHQSKFVEDLTPYEKAGDKYGNISDFYKPYIQPMTADGQVFGLPVYGETTWLMYRKDLFEKYGIANPPATMDELEADAKLIKQKSGGTVAGITLRGAPGIQSVYPWAGFLRAFGGDWTNNSGKLDVDTPQAVKAAAFWGDLLRNDGLSGVANFDWQQNLTAFTDGKAAMTIDATANGPYNENPQSSKVAGKVGYAPVPYAIPNPPASGNTNHSLEVHGMYLSSFSQNKQAAYDFMAWATSPKVQQNAVQSADGVGATATSVLESAEFKKQFGAFLQPMLDQLKTGNPDYLPAGTNANTVITDVGQALSKVLAGQASAQSALQQAQTQIASQTGQ